MLGHMQLTFSTSQEDFLCIGIFRPLRSHFLPYIYVYNQHRLTVLLSPCVFLLTLPRDISTMTTDMDPLTNSQVRLGLSPITVWELSIAVVFVDEPTSASK